jgi:hypothetical protein
MQRSAGTKLKKQKKSYKEPALKKLTPEQAKTFLIHHAKAGDQGAKDILKVVLPDGTDWKE